MYIDPYLVARQLPLHPVEGTSWPGSSIITHALRGIPHRHDRLTFIWAATWAAQSDAIEFDLRDVATDFGLNRSPAEIAKSLERLHHSRAEIQCRDSRPTAFPSMLSTFEHLAISRSEERATIRFGSLFRHQALIPVTGDVIQVLVCARSLRTLDQYLWQATKAHLHCKDLPIAIPLETVLTELACHQSQRRKALHFLRKRQQQLQRLLPNCPHSIEGDQFILRSPDDQR